MESSIRNIELAPEGQKKIDWAKESMDILNQILRKYKGQSPLENYRVSICLHLEAKTAYMALALSELGAEVTICGSNPLSTQDDVAAALVEKGITVHSWYGASMAEYKEHIKTVVDSKPHLIIDDGGDLVEEINSRKPELIENILGGSEETTTGIHRLESLEKENRLKFPMIAVNDAHSKYLFDNRYGTGQSVWDGIMRTTNQVVAGKTVVIVGYGWCGKGVAMRAKGLGARVIVCEVDAIKASEAWMDGFRVMKMEDAAARGDIFITVTGCCDVIRTEHFQKMKDGAILANAGHFDVEINKNDLEKCSLQMEKVRKNITQYTLPEDKNLYLLAEGRLVNLAAADGHPVEIMDMSFSLQALSLIYLTNNSDLECGLHKVPDNIDQQVARLKLESLNLEIDQLTEEQKKYLNSSSG